MVESGDTEIAINPPLNFTFMLMLLSCPSSFEEPPAIDFLLLLEEIIAMFFCYEIINICNILQSVRIFGFNYTIIEYLEVMVI